MNSSAEFLKVGIQNLIFPKQKWDFKNPTLRNRGPYKTYRLWYVNTRYKNPLDILK